MKANCIVYICLWTRKIWKKKKILIFSKRHKRTEFIRRRGEGTNFVLFVPRMGGRMTDITRNDPMLTLSVSFALTRYLLAMYIAIFLYQLTVTIATNYEHKTWKAPWLILIKLFKSINIYLISNFPLWLFVFVCILFLARFFRFLYSIANIMLLWMAISLVYHM